MFDISDEHVLDREHGPDAPVARGESPEAPVLATLVYNQTDPMLLRDGVDRIDIRDASDGAGERYRVDYTGFAVGTLLLTREGLAELIGDVFSTDTGIPSWILSVEHPELALGDDALWWVPDAYDPDQTVACATCGDAVAVDEVLTLGDREDQAGYRCRDCWEGKSW